MRLGQFLRALRTSACSTVARASIWRSSCRAATPSAAAISTVRPTDQSASKRTVCVCSAAPNETATEIGGWSSVCHAVMSSGPPESITARSTPVRLAAMARHSASGTRAGALVVSPMAGSRSSTTPVWWITQTAPSRPTSTAR